MFFCIQKKLRAGAWFKRRRLSMLKKNHLFDWLTGDFPIFCAPQLSFFLFLCYNKSRPFFQNRMRFRSSTLCESSDNKRDTSCPGIPHKRVVTRFKGCI
ncbi:hypothetical protein CLOSTMETH_02629 [[Clostridium] methylpentosum DSM 5476]|uniref:Uncharacterized protein n=1 Tax=[Clostridium] methylpentosum DSM 5476 TaxID=537013 RepID=C0EFI7_9FIRM|nr:hypothetical protein CLOSTMETH_02629 [[Clostridium] methylpentosum DSM 5476]